MILQITIKTYCTLISVTLSVSLFLFSNNFHASNNT